MAFKLEERVLCFHGPLLYEAKVLKSKSDVIVPEDEKKSAAYKEVSYLVHYKGWKRTWDEWVTEDRIRKWNEENLKHSKELKMEALAAQKRASDTAAQKRSNTAASNGKDAQSATAHEKADSVASRGQKRLRDPEQDRDDAMRPSINLEIPDILKARLVDDWEWITKDQRLVPLPRKPSVSQILLDYRMSVPSKRPGSAEAETFEELMSGLQIYFDKCLGTILLYRFERQQYAEIRREHGPDARMSEIYGAEHFLRLFVSMPELVAATKMDYQAVDLLCKSLQDMMRYLAKHMDTIFVEEYDVSSASYSRILHYQ